MSAFDTPLRSIALSDRKENADIRSRAEHISNKLDSDSRTPSKRQPLGLLSNGNRSILQSGAQRIIPSEKPIKSLVTPVRSKSHFMQPTEAYRNSRNTQAAKPTVSLKQSVAASPAMNTPSAAAKGRVSGPVVTPLSTKGKASHATPTVVYQDITTPIRSKATATQRASSTPPSAKRPPSAANKSVSASAAMRPAERAIYRPASPPRTAEHTQSVAQNILFSPPRSTRGDAGHHEDAVSLSGGSRRSQSAARTRRERDADQQLGARRADPQRTEFTSSPVDGAKGVRAERVLLRRAGEGKGYDMREKTMTLLEKKKALALAARKESKPLSSPSATAAATIGGSGEKAQRPRASAKERDVAAAPLRGTPVREGAASAPSSAAKSIPLFKNPAPASLLVTTADTLSANKAAKKAVIASFKASAAPHHHYSAPTQASSAAAAAVNVTPVRAARVAVVTPGSAGGAAAASDSAAPVHSTPTRGAKGSRGGERKTAVVTPSTPSRTEHTAAKTPERAPRFSLGAAAGESAVLGSGAKRVLPKKAKKVTISAHSPTVMTVPAAASHHAAEKGTGGTVRLRATPTAAFSGNSSVRSSAVNGIDAGEVLDMISAQERAMQQPSLAGQSGLRPEMSMRRRSMSFGSELSAVDHASSFDTAHLAGDIASLLSDTLNLSGNTSVFEPFVAQSPSFDGLTPDGTMASSLFALHRDALARLQLEHDVMDLSAVMQSHSIAPSPVSLASASLSAFSPIAAPAPPAPHTASTTSSAFNPAGSSSNFRADMLQQSRKPSRHNHNTATATSRSTDFSNFYAQYHHDANGSFHQLPHATASSRAGSTSSSSQLLRKSLSNGLSALTPIERSNSQHYLCSLSMCDTPQLSRQTSAATQEGPAAEDEECYRASVDSATFFDSSVVGRYPYEEEGEGEGDRTCDSSVLNRGMVVLESASSSVVASSDGTSLRMSFNTLRSETSRMSSSAAAAMHSYSYSTLTSGGGGALNRGMMMSTDDFANDCNAPSPSLRSMSLLSVTASFASTAANTPRHMWLSGGEEEEECQSPAGSDGPELESATVDVDDTTAGDLDRGMLLLDSTSGSELLHAERSEYSYLLQQTQQSSPSASASAVDSCDGSLQQSAPNNDAENSRSAESSVDMADYPSACVDAESAIYSAVGDDSDDLGVGEDLSSDSAAALMTSAQEWRLDAMCADKQLVDASATAGYSVFDVSAVTTVRGSRGAETTAIPVDEDSIHDLGGASGGESLLALGASGDFALQDGTAAGEEDTSGGSSGTQHGSSGDAPNMESDHSGESAAAAFHYVEDTEGVDGAEEEEYAMRSFSFSGRSSGEQDDMVRLCEVGEEEEEMLEREYRGNSELSVSADLRDESHFTRHARQPSHTFITGEESAILHCDDDEEEEDSEHGNFQDDSVALGLSTLHRSGEANQSSHPPTLADSWDCKPRSHVPVPTAVAGGLAVHPVPTRNYLHFEGRHRCVPHTEHEEGDNHGVTHEYAAVDAAEATGEILGNSSSDSSGHNFVSSLPPISRREYALPDPILSEDGQQQQPSSSGSLVDSSMVSTNSSRLSNCSSFSTSSHTSSEHELQRHNPRSGKGPHWAAVHYSAFSASSRGELMRRDPVAEQVLLQSAAHQLEPVEFSGAAAGSTVEQMMTI